MSTVIETNVRLFSWFNAVADSAKPTGAQQMTAAEAACWAVGGVVR